MGYVNIKIQKPACLEDLKKWEDHMLEKAKCWNKFCLGIYDDKDLQAVHVVKEGNNDPIFLTTICKDCIKDSPHYELLINENHLMVESQKKNNSDK